tara:strand:- start:1582 stop:2106 length:525 start_codon:yes stop_codon:yes gene_type:complete
MDLIDSKLSILFNNKFSSTIIIIILVGYASLVRNTVPLFIVKLFDNPIFRILVLSLIIYKGNKDPKLAICIAIAFTITMNLISKQKILENFADHTSIPDTQPSSEPDYSTDTTSDSTTDPNSTNDSDADSTGDPTTDPTADPSAGSTTDPTADPTADTTDADDTGAMVDENDTM